MRRSCALHSVPLPRVRVPSIIVLGGDLVLWNSIHAAIFQLWNIALKSDYSERQERFTPVNATTGRFTPVVNPVGHWTCKRRTISTWQSGQLTVNSGPPNFHSSLGYHYEIVGTLSGGGLDSGLNGTYGY